MTMTDRPPSFSRSLPEIGKRPERIRVSVSSDMLVDIKRECERLGYRDIADWAFDAVLEKLYGQDYVRRLHQAEFDRLQKLLGIAGPAGENGVPDGRSL